MALVGPKAKKERRKRSGGEKHLSLGSQVLPMQRPVGLSVLMENSSGWDFDRLEIYNGHCLSTGLGHRVPGSLVKHRSAQGISEWVLWDKHPCKWIV